MLNKIETQIAVAELMLEDCYRRQREWLNQTGKPMSAKTWTSQLESFLFRKLAVLEAQKTLAEKVAA